MILNELAERLTSALDPAKSLNQLIEQWLPRPLPVGPWELWTLLSLVKHRRRQEFVGNIVRYRLSGDLGLIAGRGAFGHPPGSRTGLVPGESEWEFCFHGIGCCLTHRITGESIDVDFHDETADWSQPWFYEVYLRSLQSPELSERRVLQLHPSIETVMFAFVELCELGLLEPKTESTGENVCRIAGDHGPLLELLDHVEDGLQGADGEHRLAAALGDWTWLNANRLDLPQSEELRRFADQLRSNRCERLRKELKSKRNGGRALRALAETPDPQLSSLLMNSLQGRPTHLTSEALEIINESGDDRWLDPVLALNRRMGRENDAPGWWDSMVYLVPRMPDSKEVIQRLSEAGDHDCGEAALLALEHAPNVALALFRRALRSSIPQTRIVASAVLAILDQPWSQRELLQILAESNEQEPTAECRAALLETHSTEADDAVQRWEEQNPSEPQTANHSRCATHTCVTCQTRFAPKCRNGTTACCRSER